MGCPEHGSECSTIAVGESGTLTIYLSNPDSRRPVDECRAYGRSILRAVRKLQRQAKGAPLIDVGILCPWCREVEEGETAAERRHHEERCEWNGDMDCPKCERRVDEDGEIGNPFSLAHHLRYCRGGPGSGPKNRLANLLRKERELAPLDDLSEGGMDE
jgi:hypothetical protein